MKKLFFLIPASILLSCSTDSNEIKDDLQNETENSLPIINDIAFSIDEHSEAGTLIGTVSASDADNDELTFTIDNESGLVINEETGELSLGNNQLLDYEENEIIAFTVSVFDGKTIIDRSFELAINNIDEYELLSEIQKETISYYQYLTLWQAPTNNPLEKTSRWVEPMKLYLDGQITPEFRVTVAAIIEEYNTIFVDSDFSMSLVDTLEESNAHLYFGDTSELELLWPDMFEIVDGNTSVGYAMTANNNSVLSNTRMWVSNPISVLFKHEMGHALGFGHSEKCETENSFMCSSIDANHDFLEVEKEIMSYAYGNDMDAGLSSEEIRTFLANKMIMKD
jgi:hypothetical protein